MRLFNWLKSVRNRVGRRGSRRRTGLGQRALSAWSSFGITSATVAPSVEPLEDRSMLTFMATLSATAVTITGDLAGDTLTFDVDDSGFLQHDRAGDAGFNSSIDLDSSTSGDQSLLASSVTSLTVNAGDGADTITLSAALTGLTGAVTINGDGGNDTVNLNADITFASGNSLNVDLTNDAAGGDVEARRLALELDEALRVLSTFDEGPDLVLHYKALMVLEGHAAYEHHINPSDTLSPTQRAHTHAQWRLFREWWKAWPGAQG